MDEDEDEYVEPEFECAEYWTGSEWYCPLAGTEECDWDCPNH